MSYDTAKVPPQSLESEEAVIGALLIESDAISQVEEMLRPEHFYSTVHQRVYEAILKLSKEFTPIDIVTVTQKLRSLGYLEQVGGSVNIVQLSRRVNSATYIVTHCRLILEASMKRELANLCYELESAAFDETTDVFDLLARADSGVMKVTESATIGKPTDLHSDVIELVRELSERQQSGEKSWIPTGFSAIDDRLRAHPSDLTIIAARPGMGKTALVLSFARYLSATGYPVGFFSLEMSRKQLVRRMLSSESQVESKRMGDLVLDESDWLEIHNASAELAALKMFVDDMPAQSISQVRAKARSLVRREGVRVIIVDYMQLMKGDPDTIRKGNREQEIASISRGLKGIAKELDVWVIALSQLSRAVESRGDKRPQLSDLRESGSIEQDADQVAFLYRPDYYGENGMPGLCEFLCEKNRHGSTQFYAELTWKPETQTYTNGYNTLGNM